MWVQVPLKLLDESKCINFVCRYQYIDDMKWIKLFESFDEDRIHSICDEFGINQYTINPDSTVDIHYGGFDCSSRELKKLPLKFGKVIGHFDCSDNKLTSLEGAPIEVIGHFSCSDNELTTLEGTPREVSGDFYCIWNKLTNLEGGPSYVGGDFNCRNNSLITLEGAPRDIGGDFDCGSNSLTTLEGGPIEVGGGFYCSNNKLISLEGAPREVDYFNCEYNNPIEGVYNLFPDHKSYIDSQDYNYLRGTNIDKKRLEEALDELNIRMPKGIKGYNWI